MQDKKLPESIWVAFDEFTAKLVFIEWGSRYDQKRYRLMYYISADQVHKLVEKDAK